MRIVIAGREWELFVAMYGHGILDHSESVGPLVDALGEAQALAQLRQLVREFEPSSMPRTDTDVREIVRSWIASGRVWLIPVEGSYEPIAAPVEEANQASAEPEDIVEQTWIRVRIVDNGTEEPYPDIPVTLTLPDGTDVEHTTNAEGLIEVELDSAGQCVLLSELEDHDTLHTLAFAGLGDSGSSVAILARYPSWHRPQIRALTPIGKRYPATSDLRLGRVLRHEVADGETIESIAERYEISADELLSYNFETTDTAELQPLLAREVGCTATDPESGELVFSSSDDPGIIYIPRPLLLERLHTGVVHVIRVNRIDPDPPPFVLSA